MIKCVFLLLCYQLLLSDAESEFTPTIHYSTMVSSSQCGQYNITQDANYLMTALQKIAQQTQSMKRLQGTSCQSIHSSNPSAPSGYYSITTANGSVAQVYCDMEGSNCGGEGGWTRVTYINMTQAGTTCPQGLEQMSFNGSPYCGRFSSGSGCVSAILNTTISYQQVCGRVAGYQEEAPDAIQPYTGGNSPNINQVYFDGLSILHGSPHNHIWTYTAGFIESTTHNFNCPCNTGSTVQVPPYIGNDYYCESGNKVQFPDGTPCSEYSLLYAGDVLRDGQQCGGLEAPCCTDPNMPWFIKTLNKNTTDNIELRAWTMNTDCPGTVPVFLIELYIR